MEDRLHAVKGKAAVIQTGIGVDLQNSAAQTRPGECRGVLLLREVQGILIPPEAIFYDLAVWNLADAEKAGMNMIHLTEAAAAVNENAAVAVAVDGKDAFFFGGDEIQRAEKIIQAVGTGIRQRTIRRDKDEGNVDLPQHKSGEIHGIGQRIRTVGHDDAVVGIEIDFAEFRRQRFQTGNRHVLAEDAERPPFFKYKAFPTHFFRHGFIIENRAVTDAAKTVFFEIRGEGAAGLDH